MGICSAKVAVSNGAVKLVVEQGSAVEEEDPRSWDGKASGFFLFAGGHLSTKPQQSARSISAYGGVRWMQSFLKLCRIVRPNRTGDTFSPLALLVLVFPVEHINHSQRPPNGCFGASINPVESATSSHLEQSNFSNQHLRPSYLSQNDFSRHTLLGF